MEIENCQKDFFYRSIGNDKIDIRRILYMEITKERDIKKIHLSCPQKTIVWKTRDSANKILDFLGRTFFIQINQNQIVNKTYIYGRDSKWEYLQISTFTGCFGGKGYKTIELKVGKPFLTNIKGCIPEFSIRIKGNDARDIYFINPIEVTFIKITKEIKVIYLIKPVSISNKNCFKIEWRTRLKPSEIIEKLKIDGLIQVHRNFIINLTYPFIFDSELKNIHLDPKSKNIESQNELIHIGKKFKKEIMSLINYH
jgi:hypothetical protein